MAELNHNNDWAKEKNSTLTEYVEIAVVEDVALAEEYKEMLEGNDIAAEVKAEKSHSSFVFAATILVPYSSAERAVELIEERQSFDNILDDAFNEPSGEADLSAEWE